MDTGVRDQVGLELVQIDVESTIESERRGNGADNLGNETVQMFVVGTGDVQAAAADVIDSFIVNQESAVRVLNGAVGRQDSIVGLNDRGRDTRGWIDGKLKLGLLAIVGRETLEEERTKSRSSTTTERVEDEEPLEGGAVVYED